MPETILEGVEIHQCPMCKGAWFQDQELRLAKDHSDRDLGWLDFDIWKRPELFRVGGRSLDCPHCHSSMVQVLYDKTPVIVDYCRSCRGVWLERNEFPQLLRALETEVNTKTTAEYVRASLEEAKELFTGPEPLLSEWRDFKSILRLLQIRFSVEHPGFTQFLSKLPR